MTVMRSEEAFGDLLEVFGNRLTQAYGRAGATVVPVGAGEVRLLAEIAARHALSLVPVGAGSGVASRPVGDVSVRFDLMSSVRLPDGDEPWVEAEPGASWLLVDDLLHADGRGLAVYPTSAPRATVGGWLATDGIGVGSFEYGRLRENVLSAGVVLSGGEYRDVPGDELDRLLDAEPGGGLVVGARLRTRRADADVPFAAAFGETASLAGAIGSITDARLPLWHLGFLKPDLARAGRAQEGTYLLYGAYPAGREASAGGPLREAVGGFRGRMLDAAEAYRIWGNRFSPVTPSAASVPDASRLVVPLEALPGALFGLEVDGHAAVVRGSVARSGEALLLLFPGRT